MGMIKLVKHNHSANINPIVSLSGERESNSVSAPVHKIDNGKLPHFDISVVQPNAKVLRELLDNMTG